MTAPPTSLKYADLSTCSESYVEMQPVREAIEDFYTGGYKLAANAAKYIPRLIYESPKRHADRIKSGAYINYFGEITDYYASALFTQEVSVRQASDAADPTSAGDVPDEEDVYTKFAKNSDGCGHSLNEVLHDLVITGLKQRSAWLHVEMPPATPVASKADEEALGLGIPWVFEVPHEQIIDWDYDDDGELSYAVCRQTKKLKGPPGKRRGQIRECFEVWTREVNEDTQEATVSWARYVVVYDPNKKPVDGTEVPLEDSGETSFQRIPLLEMQLPEGLWIGNKLCPLAREHYQRRTTLNAAENRSLVVIPVAKLGPSVPEAGGPINSAQEDENRGADPVAAFYAKGYEVIGKDDTLEFAEPKGAAYEHVAKRIDGLKDEMFRISHQMAASANMHAGALRRSGDSKKEDRAAEALVLGAIGRIVRNFAVRIFDTIATSLGDDVVWVPNGLDTYESEDREQLLEEAVSLQLVDIPSPTFRKEHAKRLARKLVPNMPPASAAKIDDEIDDGIEADQALREIKQDAEKDSIGNPPEPPPPPPAPVIQVPGAKVKTPSAKAPKTPQAGGKKAA